jgi:hypothetical protein
VLCQRWQPGVRLLPMSDDRVETHVVLAGDEGERRGGVGAERGVGQAERWGREQQSAGAGTDYCARSCASSHSLRGSP